MLQVKMVVSSVLAGITLWGFSVAAEVTPAGKSTQIVAEQDSSAIPALYKKHLHREIDAQGLQFFKNKLSAGQSLLEIEEQIANSPEAILQKYFVAHSRKAAGPDQVQFFLGKYHAGQSLTELGKEIYRANQKSKGQEPQWAFFGR